MGLRQRLSLAVAVLHDPQILILDEPTSGVDPVARDSFWELLIDLSRKQGVTIFVTTHFMNEAMRCDRISLMNAGKVLACDAPQKLIDARGAASLEEAFIGYMEDSIADAGSGAETKEDAAVAASVVVESARPPAAGKRSELETRLGRVRAYARNETMQILRDPIRLAFAFVGSALLMLVFGFGITTDVEQIRYASLDLDHSPESQAYLEQFAGSQPYFRHTPAGSIQRRGAHATAVRRRVGGARNPTELREGLPSRRRSGGPRSGRRRHDLPRRHRRAIRRGRARHGVGGPGAGAADARLPEAQGRRRRALHVQPDVRERLFDRAGVPALLLLLIPAILMTVSIVREKELGSIINFYVTPTRRLEYLLGKQLPYLAIGMLNFVIMTLLALIVFRVPIKGSVLMLTLCTLLYVMATTGIGMVTSTFTSSQVAAVFVTAILTIVPTIQFSGLLQPVSTLQGNAGLVGAIWPASYYMHTSVGAYTKGLGPPLLVGDLAYMVICIPLLLALSVAGLKKQEK